MASTWGNSWGGSTGAWLASWDRAASPGAPDTKMDVTLSAAEVTIATVSNSAVTILVVSDRV